MCLMESEHNYNPEMTYVCLEPYHKNSHPIMLSGGQS
jgi:hypothetical protein